MKVFPDCCFVKLFKLKIRILSLFALLFLRPPCCYLSLKWLFSFWLLKPRWLLGWSTWPATVTSTKTLQLGTFWWANSSTSRSPTWVSPERSTPQTTSASSPKPCYPSAGCPLRPSLTASSPQTQTSGRLELSCGKSSATVCSPITASPTRKWWRWWERGSCCPALRTVRQGTFRLMSVISTSSGLSHGVTYLYPHLVLQSPQASLYLQFFVLF